MSNFERIRRFQLRAPGGVTGVGAELDDGTAFYHLSNGAGGIGTVDALRRRYPGMEVVYLDG